MKQFLTAFAIVLAVLLSLFLYQIYKPNLPTSDLASLSQETRDAAAKILRATAKPPSKIKWILRTAFIRKGENETNILALLRYYNSSTGPVGGMGGLVVCYDYQLDDYWVLECVFNDTDKCLLRWKLFPSWRVVAVWPSTNFSGVWINYFANGQKFTECNYTNGSRFGEQITFYPNGSKSSVTQFDNGVEKRFTGFFPSGRIQSQGQYSNGTTVGTWIQYNEDGSTNHIEVNSKP